MTRQLELGVEERSRKRDSQIVKAVNGGLENAVGRAGGTFTGFTAKYSPVECLLVIKADFPAGPQVAFIGSADLGSAIIKAVHEAARDRLRWRADRYRGST